ncbi:hypothetical protein [Embleya sp. NPDC059259]|uniref:hypothetical protein n=1 Tax=unclassified Embleya TaxID=2699296 RepID=UPI0036A18454
MDVSPDILELFPEGTTVEEGRGLIVGGVALSDVADEYSTPAYVVDEAGLRTRIRRFRQALSANAAWGTTWRSPSTGSGSRPP